MALTTSKLTELHLRNSLTHSFPLTSHSHSHSRSPSLSLLLFSSPKTPSYQLLKPFSSLRTNQNPNKPDHRLPKPRSPSSSAPWLNKWPSPSPSLDKTPEKISQANGENQFDGKRQRESEGQTRYLSNTDKGQNAIERIVLRLRNLGLGSDDEDEEEEEEEEGLDSMPVTGEEKLEDLLKREWDRPNTMFLDEMNEGGDESMLPWEREEKESEEGKVGMRRRTVVKAPTLAELTIEDEELRRLRRIGMHLRERINVPKAGITQTVLEKIHDKWRKNELVRLKFHEFLATDMKTAHEVVEVSFAVKSLVGSSIFIIFARTSTVRKLCDSNSCIAYKRCYAIAPLYM